MSEATGTGRSPAGERISLAGRSGWQLLVSYGLGSWIVLQVAETLGSLIGLPLWFGRSLLALLLFGLLLVILSMTVQASRVGAAAVPAGSRRRLQWLTLRNIGLAGLVGGVVFVLGTAAYLALRSTGVGPFGTLMSTGVLDEQDRLILADFEGPADDGALAATVTTLFRIDLAQSPSFVVLEPGQLRPVLGRMQRDADAPLDAETAIEAARREGIKAVVTGEILPVGDAFVIAVRLVSASTEEVLAAVRETAGSAAGLPKTVDRASARLRERIGESLRTIQGDPPLERVTTRSFRALEQYVRANAANDSGDFDRAVKLLEDAIAEDSTFAMAYRKMAIILANANIDRETAMVAFTRAHELRDHLTDRERWLADAAFSAYVDRDRSGAITAYQQVLDTYPSDGVALNNLAILFAEIGKPEDALALYQRSIEQGSAPSVTYSNAIEVQFLLGQADSAVATLGRFRNAFPDNPQADRHAVALASARFDYESAEKDLRDLIDSRPVVAEYEIGSRVDLATLLEIRGRLVEARALLHEAASIEQRSGRTYIGMTPDLVDSRFDATADLWYFGDPAAAVAIADTAFAPARVETLPPERRPYFDLVHFYVEADHADAALDWLNRFEAARPPDQREDDPDWHAALGEVALVEGRYGDALDQLRAAHELATPCSICWLAEIGDAFERAGQPDSAVATYTRYLEMPFLFRAEADAHNLWRILLRLATLHEEAGRPRDALRYYGWFLDLWSGADASLDGHIQAARRSMERLASAVG